VEKAIGQMLKLAFQNPYLMTRREKAGRDFISSARVCETCTNREKAPPISAIDEPDKRMLETSTRPVADKKRG